MKPKEFLNEIRKLGMEIKTMNEQIQLLGQEAQGLKTMEISDMPKGGKVRDMADIVAEIADLQVACTERIRTFSKMRNKAFSAIVQIERSELRNILMKRYFFSENWDQIAKEMNYSHRAIFKLHGTALVEFEKECSKVQLNL